MEKRLVRFPQDPRKSPLKGKFSQISKYRLATMPSFRIFRAYFLDTEQICSPGQVWKSLPDWLGSEAVVRTGIMWFYSPLIGAFPKEIYVVSQAASPLVEMQEGMEAKRR